jgi:hypothetical protein
MYIDPKDPRLTPDERRIGFAAILARAALRWRGDVIIRSPSTSNRPSSEVRQIEPRIVEPSILSAAEEKKSPSQPPGLRRARTDLGNCQPTTVMS